MSITPSKSPSPFMSELKSVVDKSKISEEVTPAFHDGVTSSDPNTVTMKNTNHTERESDGHENQGKIIFDVKEEEKARIDGTAVADNNDSVVSVASQPHGNAEVTSDGSEDKGIQEVDSSEHKHPADVDQSPQVGSDIGDDNAVQETIMVSGDAVQENVLDSGDSVQENVLDSGDAVKENVLNSGDAVQENILDSGDAVKENVLDSGDSVQENVPDKSLHAQDNGSTSIENVSSDANVPTTADIKMETTGEDEHNSSQAELASDSVQVPITANIQAEMGCVDPPSAVNDQAITEKKDEVELAFRNNHDKTEKDNVNDRVRPTCIGGVPLTNSIIAEMNDHAKKPAQDSSDLNSESSLKANSKSTSNGLYLF